MKNRLLTTIAGVILSTPATLPAAQLKSSPVTPNLLVILADDLGYGDVQCYNPERGKIPTPNIDRLAKQGMRFTDAHSSSGVCSPSRYSLLTGRYHWRSRLQKGIVQVWERPLVAPDRLTLAELAKQHGYRAACVGKWHLGWDWGIAPEQRKQFEGLGGQAGGGAAKVMTSVTDAQRATWRGVFSRPLGGGPLAAGFDSYFGTDVPNWPPYCFIEDNRTLGIPSELLPPEKLRQHQASLQGPALAGWQLERILPTLTDRACAFLADAAKQSKPFLLYLPLTSPHTPLAVNEPWRGRSGLGAYADFVMETDATVGRVLEALDRGSLAGRTLVIFTSDNGCAHYIGAKELEAKGHFPSGPLRGYKADAWEGGHRVPFIARWPGVVKPDTVSGQLVQQTDLLATFADVLGAKLPANAGEDSYSLLPLLSGEEKPVREHAVNCAASGVPALRQGSWKLVLGNASGGLSQERDANSIKLFNLADDLGETNNLAADEPARVAAMQTLLEKLIADGRSTPGPPQQNDVEVRRPRPQTTPR